MTSAHHGIDEESISIHRPAAENLYRETPVWSIFLQIF
jgi:hypothetical protein